MSDKAWSFMGANLEAARDKVTRTIELSGVPEELIKRLDERLREVGQDRAEYLINLIQRDLERPTLTLREIFAPVREEIRESGISDTELDTFFRRG